MAQAFEKLIKKPSSANVTGLRNKLEGASAEYKNRHIFGMLLDSSSKHHTGNMKLLLVTLTCLAVSSAAPVEKEKRDILPGDPRYGTDQHHHHHENVIEDTRKSNDFPQFFAQTNSHGAQVQLPTNSYGPPGFQPGTPLNNGFGASTTDLAHFSTPEPILQTTDSVQTSQLNNRYIPVNVEVKKTMTTATIFDENTNIAKTLPTSSYGTPVIHAKTTFGGSSDSRIETALKTEKTELHDHRLLDVPPPQLKVANHAIINQGATNYGAGVKSIPSTTTFTKNVHADTLFTDNVPSFQSSFRETYNAPSFNVPSTIYTNLQPSYNTYPTGYAGLGADYSLRTLNQQFQFQQPFTTYFNNIPTAFSLPQTSYQFPQTFTHITQHSAPSLKTVQNYPVQTLTQLQPAHHSVETLTNLQPAHHAVETLTNLQPAHHSVETQAQVQPAHHSVETLAQVQPSHHSVKTLTNLQPAHHTVKTLTNLQPALHSVQTLTTPHPPHHRVETLTQLQKTQSVEVLPQHTVIESEKINATPLIQTHIQKGPISDFFQNLSENLPSFPSFPSLPSLPSFPGLPTLPSTPAPEVGLSTPIPSVTNGKESIAIENPSLPSDNNLKDNGILHVTPTNHYVQPTDANGGYIY